MGLAYKASQPAHFASFGRVTPDFFTRRNSGRHDVRVRVNSASVGASLPSGRVVPVTERPQQQTARLGAAGANGAGAGGAEARAASNGVVTAAVSAAALPSTEQEVSVIVKSPPTSSARQPQPVFTPVPEDVIAEFEHKLEADLQTVGVTLTAILGVIIFWRGVWALLDHFVGDSVVGDICCIIAGLTIVLYIRLSGMKIASFWPPS